MTPTPEQIAKLPKWAAQHIKVLEMRVAEAQAALAVGPENSDTFIRQGYSGAKSKPTDFQPLGTGPKVLFGATIEEYGAAATFEVAFHSMDGYLEIYTNTAASMLQVEPRSSNVVRIRSAQFKPNERNVLR